MSHMNLFFDNRNNRVYLRTNQRHQQNNHNRQLMNQQQNIQSRLIQQQQQQQQQQQYLHQQESQQSHQQSQQQSQSELQETHILSNNNNDETQLQDSDSKNLVEINMKELFDKYAPMYLNANSNSSSNSNSSVVEGPRGFPGMIGPQGPSGPPGPPGPGLDEDLIDDLKELLVNTMHNTKNIRPLLYGIKKTNITESNHLQINSNSYLKIMKNNEIGSTIIYDSFYLSPNVLEINDYSHNNFIHEKKVEKFINIYDEKDVQYFPIDYVPSGFPINLKNPQRKYKKLVIQNLSWNIIQNLNDNKYEEINILGVTSNIDHINYKKINLDINFELHSQIPIHLLNDRKNIIPYRNNNILSMNPSSTCLYRIPKIKINELNGLKDYEVKIDIENLYNLNNALLCVRVSIDEDNIYYLKGNDINQKLVYGYVPFTQFLLNFDYHLE